MDGNHAKNFLLQKRGTGNKWCEEYQIIAEQTQEDKLIRWGSTPNIYEECCKEGCRAEEIRESDPHYKGNVSTNAVIYIDFSKGKREALERSFY